MSESTRQAASSSAHDHPRSGKLHAAALAVERFYLGDFPIHPIVLIRIGLGCIFAMRYSILSASREAVWGADGLLAHVVGPSWVTGHSQLVFTVLIVAALCYAAGLLTRVSGLLLIGCHIAIHSVSWTYAWGDATTGHLFILYTLFSNPGGRLSVDAALRKRLDPDHKLPETSPAIAARFLQFHIVAIYFMAAYNRLFSKGWRLGRMTLVAVYHSIFSRSPELDYHSIRPLMWLATWYTWILELLAPVLLWLRRIGPVWVFLLMSMHFGLHVSSTIGSWQLHMLCILIIFLPPDWFRRPVEWGERLVGLAQPAEPEAAMPSQSSP